MQYRLKRTPFTKLQINLSYLMAGRGIKSGTKLAEELRIPPQSINRILSGQVLDPRLSTLILIADYFEVSIDDLIGRECDEEDVAPEEEAD